MKNQITLLILLFSIFSLNIKAQETKPNVVFFAVDDLNDWVLPIGGTQAITPNLERLAAMGITFTEAHAPATYCAPSRTAIWSGLLPSTTGHYGGQILWHNQPSIKNIQSTFKASGYKTYGAGKNWHHIVGNLDLRDWDHYYARNLESRSRGMDVRYLGDDVPLPSPYPYGGYWNHPEVDERGFAQNGYLDWGPLKEEDKDKHLDAYTGKFAADLINCYSDEDPFFLAVGIYSPHYPNYVPQRFFDMYNEDNVNLPVLHPSIENGWAEDLSDIPEHTRVRVSERSGLIQNQMYNLGIWKEAVEGYLASISYADYQLGRVLDALENSGKIENTIIVFWSDHGYHLGGKGQWGKRMLWRQATHVPLLFGGKINGEPLPVGTVDKSVSLVDMYPTLVDMCDLTPPEHTLDGVSLWPTIQDPASAEDRTIAILDERSHWGGYALTNTQWKYIKYRDGGVDGTEFGDELYDLTVDPSEFNNLLFDGINTAEQAIIDQLEAEALPDTFANSAPDHRTSTLVVYPSGWYYRYNDSDPDPMTPQPVDWPGTTCIDAGDFLHEDFTTTNVTFNLPREENGMIFLDNADTEQQVVGGVNARRVPNGRYAYFDVSNIIIPSDESIVYFGITYYDESHDPFEIQYNSTTADNKPFTITRNNTGTWITKTLMVVDAKFDNQLSGYDFRISGGVTLESVFAAKPPYSDVSIVFDDPSIYPNGFLLNGMNYHFRADSPNQGAYTLPGFVQDNHCRAIVESLESTTGILENKRGVFQLDSPSEFTGYADLEVSITYFETGKPLELRYNAIGNPSKNVEISPTTNLNQWVTKTLRINDAALNNLSLNSGSITIFSNQKVKRLALKKALTLNNSLLTKNNHRVDFSYESGTLSIIIPKESNNVDYTVYNLAGQVVVKKTKMHSYMEKVPLKTDGFYIVHVNFNGVRVVKKIITGKNIYDRT